MPVFDQNQAQVSRAQYQSLELQRIGNRTIGPRAALDRALLAARAAVFARDELLAQAGRSLALARRAFELCEVTLLTLLDAERALLVARRTNLDSRFEAARACNEVERAAGAPIDWME